MKEIWKDIPGYEGLYQVSDLGRIKRLPKLVKNEGLRNKSKTFISKELIIKPFNISKGYKGVILTKNGKRTNKKLHRLVAEVFIENPFNKPQVNHIDCDKTNNKVTNLEWVTGSENIIHAVKNGLQHPELIAKKRWRKIKCQ